MIISYEMFVRNYEDVAAVPFDLIICDEGHRLKNNSIRASTVTSDHVYEECNVFFVLYYVHYNLGTVQVHTFVIKYIVWQTKKKMYLRIFYYDLLGIVKKKLASIYVLGPKLHDSTSTVSPLAQTVG